MKKKGFMAIAVADLWAYIVFILFVVIILALVKSSISPIQASISSSPITSQMVDRELRAALDIEVEIEDTKIKVIDILPLLPDSTYDDLVIHELIKHLVIHDEFLQLITKPFLTARGYKITKDGTQILRIVPSGEIVKIQINDIQTTYPYMVNGKKYEIQLELYVDEITGTLS
jgi:hypothetical protein